MNFPNLDFMARLRFYRRSWPYLPPGPFSPRGRINPRTEASRQAALERALLEDGRLTDKGHPRYGTATAVFHWRSRLRRAVRRAGAPVGLRPSLYWLVP